MSLLSVSAVLLMGLTALVPVSIAAGEAQPCSTPYDTSPPFTDYCYHQGVWFSPDTADIDVLIFPPASPYEAREWQLVEQSVDNWEDGIHALGAPWLSGLHINDYTVGRQSIPAEAWADPEVLVILHGNVDPAGYAGAATQHPGVCHGIELPSDPTSQPTWHNHGGSPYGHYMTECKGGGRLCVVTDAAALSTPTDNDRRVNFDLVSHEVGHCLTLGHVGDADTESTDDSLAYPQDDIMSYENDGFHAATMHCPSNLDVHTIEKAFGSLLGQPGATTAVAPAPDGYTNMRPGEWRAPPCRQSTAAYTDLDYLTSTDPTAPETDDSGGSQGTPVVTIDSPADGATDLASPVTVAGTVNRAGDGGGGPAPDATSIGTDPAGDTAD